MKCATPDQVNQVLHAAQAAKRDADDAQRDLLLTALDWCKLHLADHLSNPHDFAYWPGTNQELSLGGPGAPRIYETAVVEYAAALGYSTDTARSWLADALELAYRLPRLFTRVVNAGVPVWRARRIAERTHHLPVEAAEFVDQHLAGVAHRVGLAQIDRAVAEAKTRFCVGEVQDAALDDRDQLGVFVEDQPAPGGTMRVEARLDVADALDLDSAVRREAALLARLGSTQPLDARRAAGLGNLARRQLSLDLTGTDSSVDSGTAAPAAPAADAQPVDPEVLIPATQPATVYFHIREPGLDPDAASRARPGAAMPTVWCGNRRGGALDLDAFVLMLEHRRNKVVVKPVIDLNSAVESTGYQPTAKQIEQLYLRDEHCVFPSCTRTARPPVADKSRTNTDADHINPWPEGKTSTDNLAPLCRLHHRHKTHHGWSYESSRPGRYRWTSPLGHSYAVNTTSDPDP